ncbi:MAG: helix-turn-helix domain-containing protein [Candidatus Ratteibacteria bacterium]|jgi:excisionase family DNA binding protein
MEKRLVNIKAASEYLSIPIGSLYKMVWQKRLPFVVKSGRALRFDKVKMDLWIEVQTQEVKNF